MEEIPHARHSDYTLMAHLLAQAFWQPALFRFRSLGLKNPRHDLFVRGKSRTLTLAVRERSIFAERRRYGDLLTLCADDPLAEHERRFVH